MANFGDSKQVKLRKDKRCSWCGQVMKKGEVVYHFKGRWDGDWQNWKMHNECEQVYRNDEYCEEGFSLFNNTRPTTEQLPDQTKGEGL